MKVLLVYATKSGCTAGVAERIAKTLGDAGAAVDIHSAGKAPDASGYDAVVIGSGVRAGSWHGDAKAWVASNAETLKSVPVAFFTCGMMLTQGVEKADEMRAYTETLVAETGVEPIESGVFAGWFEPKSFSVPERMILKMMKTPQGDFRDWAAIEAWALALSKTLGISA